jgi:ABC-type Fe3+/spermidine/putrescine transport system ATPase subunit
MFQDYALFPNKDVARNVAYGLRMQRRPEAEVRRRVTAVLALVDPGGYAQPSVTTLPAGEQPRVALARALAPEPRLLMLDEPLGALDRTLRDRLTHELRDLLRRLGMTAIYVTHDHAEARALGDRLVVMRAGHIEQIGRPDEVVAHPANEFVADFVGGGGPHDR